jgi:hypothetical protein
MFRGFVFGEHAFSVFSLCPKTIKLAPMALGEMQRASFFINLPERPYEDAVRISHFL